MSKKLIQQSVDPIQILKKVGRFAYRLNVLANRKVQLVLLVAQLKLASASTLDSFLRPFFFQSLLIFINSNKDTLKSFEIERLFNKHIALSEIDDIISKTSIILPNLCKTTRPVCKLLLDSTLSTRTLIFLFVRRKVIIIFISNLSFHFYSFI